MGGSAAPSYIDIRPQAGPQEDFLSSEADIAVYGGQAGGGKSFAILLDPVRFIQVKGFGAVIFRRNSTDLTQEGGLWDESMKIYPALAGRPRESQGRLDWRFPWGARISFSHLQSEDTVQSKMGGQIAMLGYDELTHFTWNQFWLMNSRNRSTCGVRPYIRATCNPDPDSWVANFIAWWICEKTGYPISKHWWHLIDPKYRGVERSGVLRWLIKIDESLHWFDSKAEAIVWRDNHGYDDSYEAMSVTFIPARLADNPALIEKDPTYRSKLAALGRVDRARLLEGNWKVRKTAGLVFNRDDFGVIDSVRETEIIKRIRRWDFAGTEAKRASNPRTMSNRLINDPDWTVGMKAVMLRDRTIVITDLRRDRCGPSKVKQMVTDTAAADGKGVHIWIPQDPGQAGKAQVDDYVKTLLGYTVRSERESGSKLTRAEPYSAYAENGKVKILRAAWNDVFLAEHEAFPTEGVHDDIVDCGSGAYRALTEKGPSTTEMMARARAEGRLKQ